MPSTNSNFEQERQAELGGAFAQELRAIPLADSLRSQIQLLTQRRREAYVQAQAYRCGGHLVPGSLTAEMAENGLQLEYALKRYAEANGEDPVMAGA
jgi:hypothetical protein